MCDADDSETGLALKLFDLILDPVVSDDCLRLALGADHVVRRIDIIFHALQVLLDDRGRHKRNINSWTDHALETVIGVVPVKSIELRVRFATNLAFNLLRKETAALQHRDCCSVDALERRIVGYQIYLKLVFLPWTEPFFRFGLDQILNRGHS